MVELIIYRIHQKKKRRKKKQSLKYFHDQKRGEKGCCAQPCVWEREMRKVNVAKTFNQI